MSTPTKSTAFRSSGRISPTDWYANARWDERDLLGYPPCAFPALVVQSQLAYG
jgi:hypothetical protein